MIKLTTKIKSDNIFVLKKPLHTIDQFFSEMIVGFWDKGTTGNWFGSFLKTRNNSLLLIDKNSKVRNSRCVIPQGS